MEKMDFRYSPTVSDVRSNFPPELLIDATAMVQEVLNLYNHAEEYAGGQLASLSLKKTPIEMTAQAWIEEVQTLFDPVRIAELTKTEGSPVLHGRLLIAGLCLLEPVLYQQVEQVGVFSGIMAEIQEPFEDILSDRGNELYPPTTTVESVPNWPDDPLEDAKDDRLGRRAFARFLSKRIRQVPKESGAYAIHLYGAWGSGKSSLLSLIDSELNDKFLFSMDSNLENVLKPGIPSHRIREIFEDQGETISSRAKLKLSPDKMRWLLIDKGMNQRYQIIKGTEVNEGKLLVESDKKRWLVVNYNAWRNQHIDPPWWSLMDTIYKGVKKNLRLIDKKKEFCWRLFSGRTVIIFSIVVLAWVIAISGWFVRRSIIEPMLTQGAQPTQITSSIAGVFENVGSIVAFFVTIWGYLAANNNSLLLGSSGAAKCYQERVRDPMNEIKNRFIKLISRLLPQRVAVFVDDLDRCRSEYVVDLLEGIQTLFRDAPVIFVVAADRRWLHACYEQVYADLKTQIQRPGKTLGMLFLEKAFRFTTPLPGIPKALKEAYWNYLLLPAEERRIDWAQLRNDAREQAGRYQRAGDLQNLIEEGRDRSFAEQQVLREEIAVRLADPEIRENLEHVLEPYASLLDQNPRAMKRLVNAYSANWSLAVLSEIEIDRHQLVLWTILSARWPELALELEDASEKSAWFRKKTPDAPNIYQDAEILKVVNGGEIGSALTQDTIRKCKQMHA